MCGRAYLGLGFGDVAINECREMLELAVTYNC